MEKIYIINAHEPYAFAKGRLTRTLVEIASRKLEGKGCVVQMITMQEEYDVQAEVDKHAWADAIILQMPVYWMSVPWSFKKYMDHVYTAGLDGRLSLGDGRTRKDPSKQYGTGGSLRGKKYMLSLTFNAPASAFNDAAQYLFQGKSVDDLLWPMHLCFRFFGMAPLETFACHDVHKNPHLEKDFKRFEAHLDKVFS